MMSRDLARYVDQQRSLGFKFRVQHILLRGYVAFAEERGDRHIKSARVLAWAARAPSPEQCRNRLLTVRRFALAMHAENTRHQVPAADALGHAVAKRRSPYIYGADEIARLLRAAAALQPTGSIRPTMYATLFGLLAATGMRIAEALALQLDDVTADGLVIRETKFQKSRLLPLHTTARQALDGYLIARRSFITLDRALFVSIAGGALPYNTVRSIFLQLLDRSNLRGAQSGRDPRIHDLRHTFAVRSLEQCRHDRAAISRHLVALSTYLGHAHVTDTYWYLQATPVLMGQIAEAGEALLQGAAAKERRASQHTSEAYAQSFQLLLCFAAGRLKVTPAKIEIERLDAPLILAFLEHLEKKRGNSARTRNARLAAINAFFRFLEYRLPSCLDQSRRIHAIPMKKTDQALVGYLTRDELQALLDAPDPSTLSGIRDRAMLHLAFAAGLRVSELVSLRLDQIDRQTMSSVHIVGKGRRERVLPLWKETAAAVKVWLKVRPANAAPELFLNARAQAMTRSGFEYILEKHVAIAARKAPSIAGKGVSPHVLRHTCAMHTLQATRDVRKVSLWLGHASLQSTEVYLRADPTEKLEALAAMVPPTLKTGRFRAPDKLLAMLSTAGRKPNYAE